MVDFRVLKLDRVIAGGPASQAGSGKCYAVPTACGRWVTISLHSDFVGEGREWVDVHQQPRDEAPAGKRVQLIGDWAKLTREALARKGYELHPFTVIEAPRPAVEATP